MSFKATSGSQRDNLLSITATTSKSGFYRKPLAVFEPNAPSCDEDHIPSSRDRRCKKLLTPSSSGRDKSLDIESASAREHVLLRITGITCTGCASKAINALSRIDGVSNVKINFVAATGEFDVDRRTVLDPDLIIHQLRRETGFECTRISSNLQILDVGMVDTNAREFQNRMPIGVDAIYKKSKKIYCISYNPTMIGARKVMLSAFPAQLAPASNESALHKEKKHLVNTILSFLMTAACTIPVVVLAWAPHHVPSLMSSIVSLVLATLVQIVAVPHFYVPAIKSLVFSRLVEIDMLVVISITTAYGYSVVAFALTIYGSKLVQGALFETSSLLVTLMLLGRLVATFARLRAYSAVSFKSLQAQTAQLVQDKEVTEHIDVRLLEYGDTILVPPHSRIVTDGTIVNGSSSIDESILTGEIIPVAKTTGDLVVAGTMNGSSLLRVHVTRLPGRNSISDVAHLVENALSSTPRTQELADRLAGYFVRVVSSIAFVVFVTWLVVGFKAHKENAGGAIGLAITYGIAVLAVSCPCALGLAVPMVLVIAVGIAARAGVIIKQAVAIESTQSVTDVVFDKTGTLTTSALEIVYEQIRHEDLSDNTIKLVVRGLVKDIQHPVSRALNIHLENLRGEEPELMDVKSIPGCGMQATFMEKSVLAGNPYWLNIQHKPEVMSLIDNGLTLFCVCFEGAKEPFATYGLRSTLRPEAATVVTNLHNHGITTHIVSGDGPIVVAGVARSVGIALTNIASQHTPATKGSYVKKLRQSGRSVLFCGDGTNDAVAIAQANVGVQIGKASDITNAVADVVLLGGLDGIPFLLDLSKRTSRRIMFNFVWSAVYNLLAISLAAGAFVKIRIPPAYAGLGEIVSVLPVILIALTLLGSKRIR
jgi:heavy metal translocating P-type ATPase